MNKHIIQVQTIKYQDLEIPTLIKFDNKAYLITEILKEEVNVVFPLGGIGTKYSIIINKKETAIYKDKHTLKWHVYREGEDQESHKVKDGALMDVKDFRFLG